MTNVVTFGDKKIPKREIIAPVDNMSLPFTPPSADLTGLNATSYFLTPIDDTDEEDSWRQPLPRRGVASSAIHSRSAPPSTDCQGELWADVKKVQSYKYEQPETLPTGSRRLILGTRQYLDHMEVNPAVALAGFGSSAEISGNYLDQTQVSLMILLRHEPSSSLQCPGCGKPNYSLDQLQGPQAGGS